jgi:hypothetical protein
MHVVYKQHEKIKYPTLYNFTIGTELDCRKQNVKYGPQ